MEVACEDHAEAKLPSVTLHPWSCAWHSGRMMQLRDSRPMSIQSWFYMPGITLLTRTPMSRPLKLKMEEVVERTLEYTKEGDRITIQPISANRVNRTDKLYQTRKCGEIKRTSLYFVYLLSVLVAFCFFLFNLLIRSFMCLNTLLSHDLSISTPYVAHTVTTVWSDS